MSRIFLLLLFLSAGCGKKSTSIQERLDPFQRFSEQEAAALDAPSASSVDNLEAAAAAYAESDARIGRWQGGSSDFWTGASGSALEHGASEVEKFGAKPTLPEPTLESRAVYARGLMEGLF